MNRTPIIALMVLAGVLGVLWAAGAAQAGGSASFLGEPEKAESAKSLSPAEKATPLAEKSQTPSGVPASPAEKATPSAQKPAEKPADQPAAKKEEKPAKEKELVPGPLSKVIRQEARSAEPPKPKLPPIPPWTPPQAEEVRAKLFAWLDSRSVEPHVRAKVEQLWTGDLAQLRGMELLVRVVVSYALADSEAAKLVELCTSPRTHLIPPSFPWLTDPKTDAFMAANLRLLYGRWLVHEMLYDEALHILGDLNPGDVADPASLLFYQSVAYYFLLDQEHGLRSLEALLREPEYCPHRYVALATLMQEDLKNLQQETLDHIARRMRDVERRLGLGRAGPKVRTIEDKIVEDLDKMIKKLEEQQQQSGGGGGAGGRTIRSSSPAPDSRIIGGKGPGEVEKRDLGSGSGWGNLPPKEREEVLQQIGRDFPAQYRDKIEHYFRKLAGESAETKKSP